MPESLLVQVFSCEFCEISKNTFFAEHFQTPASGEMKLKEKQGVNSILLNESFKKMRRKPKQQNNG